MRSIGENKSRCCVALPERRRVENGVSRLSGCGFGFVTIRSQVIMRDRQRLPRCECLEPIREGAVVAASAEWTVVIVRNIAKKCPSQPPKPGLLAFTRWTITRR